MLFIESPHFTEDVLQLPSDDEYQAFQRYLAQNPTTGAVIEGTGGLRKVRWAARGKGKSGGVRVIYFYMATDYQIRLLLIYSKSVMDDLTPTHKKALKTVIERWQ